MGIFFSSQRVGIFYTRIVCICVWIFCLFFSGKSVFAEDTARSCSDEMIYALSTVELNYQDELTRFFDLRSSQADMKAKNISTYTQDYACQLKYVCSAFENPQVKTFQFTGCETMDAQKFLDKNEIDFSSCAVDTILVNGANRLALCQNFIAPKKKDAKDFAEKSFTQQSGTENNSFLSAKLSGMRDRMDVLYEKTRMFVRNFNKVMADINCAIPDKSF